MQNSFAIVPIKGIASPASKERPLEGGKWKIVEEFNGRSHEDGGIDIEVSGGMVRRIHAPFHKPDVIAKKGGFWKQGRSFGDMLAQGAASLYGYTEKFIDTVTLGRTDKYTDKIYETYQDKLYGTNEYKKGEMDKYRDAGQTAQSKFTNWLSDKLGITNEEETEGPTVGPPVEGPMPEIPQQRGMMPMGKSDESPYSLQNLGKSKTEGQTVTGFGGGVSSGGGSEQQFGEFGGPIQFRQHPIYSDRTQAYLNRYGINV
jgi:hypothetical protein